jgi:hypothetical protein
VPQRLWLSPRCRGSVCSPSLGLLPWRFPAVFTAFRPISDPLFDIHRILVSPPIHTSFGYGIGCIFAHLWLKMQRSRSVMIPRFLHLFEPFNSYPLYCLPSASIIWSTGSHKLISPSRKRLERHVLAVRGPPWSTLLLFQTVSSSRLPGAYDAHKSIRPQRSQSNVASLIRD